MKTRRQFLGQSGCAAMGATPALSTLLNMSLAQKVSAASQAPSSGGKSLVCLFLFGGCDSFNLLVPADDEQYNHYKDSRSNLALSKGSLLPLNGADSLNQSYGLHPSCTKMAEMFNGTGAHAGEKTLSFVAGVGTLLEKVNSEDQINTKKLPKSLFSHRSQAEQWQTSRPQGSKQLVGWQGRMADILSDDFASSNPGPVVMPMNYSLQRQTIMQSGVDKQQFVASPAGSTVFRGSRQRLAAAQSLFSDSSDHYSNFFHQTHAEITDVSNSRGAVYNENFLDRALVRNDEVIDSVLNNAGFPAKAPGPGLKAAVKTIAIRESLGLTRQTIFVEMAGWDHHGELLKNQAEMLTTMDTALSAFQLSLRKLGLEDETLLFSASDFGRTLRSNGRGSDHGWSGNSFVMGSSVAGGSITGFYPSLERGSPLDVGNGRFIPTTSCDEYFYELLCWFGVPAGQMEHILPNIREFYSANRTDDPLGFLK